MADIRAAIEPLSDRQNATDYLAGPKTFTISGTSDYRDEKGRAKVNIHLAENPDRPFKPSATNLRLIAIGWGEDDAAWVGRRIELSLDPEVTFGRDKVGGIRVTALSDMPQPFTAKLPVTRGKKAEYRVTVLSDQTAQSPYAPSQDWLALIQSATTVDEKRAIWGQATQDGADGDYLAQLKAAGGGN